ncbi:MAG: hypothetical protein ACQESP_12765, partial [Candidatus Muiribacteriota bacterium]
SPKIADNGYLLVHDIFDSQAEGGQAPRFVFEKAFASGQFELVEKIKTLGVLKKVTSGCITDRVKKDYLKFEQS